MSDPEIDINPPKGMKTVMFNNKAVGYVKDVENQQEAAQLSKELLISKGLWHEISKPQMIYGMAQSFANTAASIYNKDLKSLPRNGQSICPFIVNAAFSAELYLKCLQHIYGKPTETHVLTALYKQLPNKLKDKINKHSKAFESQHPIQQGIPFTDHLKSINHAFVNWRYIYEKSHETIQIQPIIFVLQVLHETAIIELGLKT